MDIEKILLELEALKVSNGELLESLEVLLEQEEQVFFFENGTVKCPDATVGDRGFIIGKVFEAVDRNLLIQRRNQGADLSCVCTTLVTDMSQMFSTFSNFNQDISTWDVSNVNNMSSMFRNALSFNQFIGIWDVGNVVNMSFMFDRAFVFNQPIGDWDVSSVTTFLAMFQNANEFNQPIGNWDVSNATYMIAMFNLADKFNRNLSQWCVQNIPSEPSSFSSGSPLLDANKPIWGTCPD